MKKKNSTLKQIYLIMFSFILGGVVMVCLIRFSPLLDGLIGNGTTSVITKGGKHVYEKSSLGPSIEKVYNAVVTLQCYKSGKIVSTGSGFVYKVDNQYGYILTNQHVIDGLTEVKAIMNNNEEEIETEILGGDEYLDLAVVRIPKNKVQQIAEIGSSENLNLGDSIFTVGAPMGIDYKGSVTSGIISGKDRMVSVSVGETTTKDWIMRVLQIDASINPGNSGGPLLNINGQVIGICSMKLVDSQIEGMGFAIPIEYAMNHVDKLENGKKIEWPIIGVGMLNVNDSANLYRNGVTIDKSITEGVAIVSVQAKSVADKGGLEVGDVVIKINDDKVTDTAQLRFRLYQHVQGETIKVTIIRKGKEKVLTLKL